jgi:hypothetical protein
MRTEEAIRRRRNLSFERVMVGEFLSLKSETDYPRSDEFVPGLAGGDGFGGGGGGSKSFNTERLTC